MMTECRRRAGALAATCVATALLLADTAGAQITRLNLRPDGTQSGAQGFADVSSLASSDDGRFVAFISAASDLVPGDTNDDYDAFLLDRQSGEIRMVTKAYDGSPALRGGPWSGLPVSELRISGDGSTVVFVSAFANLVAADTNGTHDVFAYDRQSGTTTRVSVGPGGQQFVDTGGFVLASPDVSHDGSVIVYTARSFILTGRPDWEVATVVVDRNAGTTSTVPFGPPSLYSSRPWQVAVSGNGRFIAGATDAALVADDTNGTGDVYVYDRQTATFERVSVTTAGAQSTAGGPRGSRHPSMSYDGRFVVFESDSATLAPQEGGGVVPTQVFLRDRQTGTTVRITEAGSVAGTADSGDARISADARMVAFLTDTPRTFSPMAFSDRDALVWERETGRFRHVNIPRDHARSLGSVAAVREAWPTNTDDIFFVSGQPNLVADDTNGAADLFVRSMAQSEPTITAIAPDSGPRDQAVEVVITGTGFAPGATVAFVHPGPTFSLTPTSVTPTSVTVTLPGGQGARTVTVATPSGVAGTTFTSGSCDHAVAPTSLLVPSEGGTYPLTVSPLPGTDTDCPWMALASASFATLDGGVSFMTGQGAASVAVLVAPNTTPDSRQGSVRLADRTVPVLQAGTAGALVPLTSGGGPVVAEVVLTHGSATMSFSQVTHAGVVSVFEQAFDPGTLMPKPGFRLLPQRASHVGGNIVFDEVALCLPFLETDAGDSVFYPSGLRLLLWSPVRYVWDDVTTHVDTAGGRVCGVSSSFGQFVIGYAQTTRYLSEGATSAFFDTRFALLNPGDTDASASLEFLRGSGAPVTQAITVPARTRVTIDARDVPGLEATEFSTVVYADQVLAVDRTMMWDATGYGAHAETAVVAASPVWYLAEGATHSGFALFYLLQNPSSVPVDVRVRYLLPAGGPLEKTYRLPASSRTNIWVNVEEFDGLGPALASTDVSAVVESLDGTPIIVERAMYLSSQGRLFNAGHASMGVTAPAREWFLAEGATGDFFDLFVLVANPMNQDADVRVVYRLGDGTYYHRTLVVEANTRSSIWVDHEEFTGVAGKPLANVAVSMSVASTNNVPIIVERAMWWPGTLATWHEAHNSAGSRETGTRWALAEGEVGGPNEIETYILLANSDGRITEATVTLLFENGTSVSETYRLLPHSRTNVNVLVDFGAAVLGRRFGALVETSDDVPIVVERAMYWNANGVHWAAGTNALATRLQ